MTVCLAASTMEHPEGGGHLWVYLNWALGLQALGCQVIWLEGIDPKMPVDEVQTLTSTLKSHLEPYGFAEDMAICSWNDEPLPQAMTQNCLDIESAFEADLLLNLAYSIPSQVVEYFQRTALVDIDPGLLQLWMSQGRVNPARHDIYFTIGETVGTPAARFSDCGLQWHYTPPAVFLPAWPTTPVASWAPFTTVSGWWEDWIVYSGKNVNNDKRTSFLEYADLPSHTSVQLELALYLSPGDDGDRRFLEQRGWKIRDSWEVTSTPKQYRAYLQQSRGEFSCAKPSSMLLQNAWISDQTLCYLASGKPAVVERTGPSSFLPDAEGLFRFRSLEEAARALDTVQSDYERQSRFARHLAEEYFDARKVVRSVLERAVA
jgi:hypothetical protein